MRNRFWRWAVVGVLAAGVGVAAIDAAQRGETLNAFNRGMGTPDNPTPAEKRRAETNLWYLMGLAVGTAAGAAAVVVILVLRTRPRRQYTVEELVAGNTEENRHPETDWGPSAGREA